MTKILEAKERKHKDIVATLHPLVKEYFNPLTESI